MNNDPQSPTLQRITILMCAAASPRSQVQDAASNRDENRRSINHQNGAQTATSSQRGDTKTNLQDYQGVMGQPGVDFPVLKFIPRTKFNCRGKKSGYYADLETNCQVFHICDEGRKVSFLCPNGTIFQQSDLICDWWFKVDCATSPTLYDESAEQLYEDNLRRKENRKVQEQERRVVKNRQNLNENRQQATKHNNNQNDNNRQSVKNNNNQNDNNRQSVTNNNNNRQAVQNSNNHNDFGRQIKKNNNNIRNVEQNSNNQNDYTPRQGREFNKQRKYVNNERNNQPSYENKDSNQYTADKYNENPSSNSNDDYLNNNYKETQIPSETASFVNNRYNSEQQKQFYKGFNDIGGSTQTYLPPKSYITGDLTAIKAAVTEKISSRGSRTFSSDFTSSKVYYRNQVPDTVKTTTQHTIYSPTVPPFTSTRHTTRAPTTLPITTPFYEAKVISNTRSKPVPGFYITKELGPSTTNVPFVTDPSFTTTQYVTEFSTQETPSSTIIPSTTTEQPDVNKEENNENLHTTPASVDPTYRPLVASEIIAGSNDGKASDSLNTRFGPTGQDFTTESIQTTTEFEFSEQTQTTDSPRKSKQILYTTPIPFENFSFQDTAIPSVPTPFKSRFDSLASVKQIIGDDTPTTYRFSQNTYLPKTTEETLSTPRPTIPTDAYVTAPAVTENLSNMIKTLEELEGKNPLDEEKSSGPRPGLNIPPSAGPKTLHSLAIYFATALDNLVSSNETTNDKIYDEQTVPTTTTIDDVQVTLLSRTTQDKYNSLFNEDQIDEQDTKNTNISTIHVKEDEESPLELKSLVEHDSQYNDLDGQQSQGPVSSTPRIRQLAQVFTQALSAYLDDPDTFKKVLEEIRPTEPPLLSEDVTETARTSTVPTSTSTTTEYRSYTKEEDEVLDFSDVDKSSTYRPYNDNSLSTTTQPILFVRSTTESYSNGISTHIPQKDDVINITKTNPTPNTLALDLNNRLKISSPILQDIDVNDETSTEDTTDSDDYFPVNTGEDDEDARRKATAKPYGIDVKPENSTPINIAPQIPPTAEDLNLLALSLNNHAHGESKPSDSLLPPFKISLNHKLEELNNSFVANEEYLQSAHSQSFVSHSNVISSDRKGKSFSGVTTDIPLSTTDLSNADTTVFTTPSPNGDIYTSTTIYETTQFTTNKQLYDETTTTESTSTSTTDYLTTEQTTRTPIEYSTISDTTTNPTEQTTNTKPVPDNHWSKSPEVRKLWETTLYVNPEIINRNLGDAGHSDVDTDTPTTYRPEFTTKSFQYKTTTEYIDESVIDLKFSTTEESLSTEFSTLAPTEINTPYPTIIDLGIHSLLNTTELEIASSQANQIFGNLNTSEQDILIEKMKEAESNSTVRRLILLLVSTCDASLSNNKTVQETRNSILHALLNIPPVRNTEVTDEVNYRSGKSLFTTDRADEVTSDYSTLPPTTTSQPDELVGKSSAIVNSAEVPNKTLDVKDVRQDTRALELLRSLYSLAAKWGKK